MSFFGYFIDVNESATSKSQFLVLVMHFDDEYITFMLICRTSHSEQIISFSYYAFVLLLITVYGSLTVTILLLDLWN